MKFGSENPEERRVWREQLRLLQHRGCCKKGLHDRQDLHAWLSACFEIFARVSTYKERFIAICDDRFLRRLMYVVGVFYFWSKRNLRGKYSLMLGLEHPGGRSLQ